MAKLSALVVDDSKVGRLTMQKRLEAIGIQVDMTESGREALDYLAHRRPDLIFMDHLMPDMDGFEVTRRIKATPGMQDIPVIIASGNDEPAFVEQARAAGAMDAITKPPPPGVLETLLADIERLGKAAAAPQQPPAPLTTGAAIREPVAHLPDAGLERLRGELLAELDSRLDAHGAAQRASIEALERAWRQDLAAVGAELAALRRAMPDGARLEHRLDALVRDVDERLAAMEAASAQAAPQSDGLRADLERALATATAESRTELERQVALARQELLASADARLRDQAERIESRLVELRGRLDAATAVGAAHGIEPPHAAWVQLRDRVKVLTLALAIGGGVLLAAVTLLLLRG